MLLGDWVAVLSPVTRGWHSRAALAIRHTVTAQLSAHRRGPAPTVAEPPRDTVQTAIRARQHQPEPAPLHPARTTVAIRAGDLARRYAARLDTRGLWQWATPGAGQR